MPLVQPLKRRPEPERADRLLFFSLVAAAGFAFGWLAQSLGGFF